MPVLARSHPHLSSRIVHGRFRTVALCHSHPRAIGEKSCINLYVTISCLTLLALYMPAITINRRAIPIEPIFPAELLYTYVSYLILISGEFSLQHYEQLSSFSPSLFTFFSVFFSPHIYVYVYMCV